MHRGHATLFTAAILAIGASTLTLSAWGGAAPPVDPEASAKQLGSPRAESDNYLVELKADAAYKSDLENNLEIAVTPKGAYHINPKFPIRFKATDPAPDGITYTKPVMTRDDGRFEEQGGGLKVPFKAQKPGKYNLGGTLSISFCSDKNCIMEKIPLDIDVVVK